jgi:mannose-1-phosphate guanylyltransferase
VINKETPWCLLLAGGDGRRLSGLTTMGGVTVPKQFCCLVGGPSLLQEALQRAQSISPPERVCAVVAATHRPWWCRQLHLLPEGNIIVQPRNRGTANGVLLGLLHILERDSGARLLLLPSDHYVADEARLAQAMLQAAGSQRSARAEIVLLGLQPRSADPELGYIIPGPESGSAYREVERFVEKPAFSVAQALAAQGALWNAFIVAAEGRALLKLFERRCPEVVKSMQAILQQVPMGPIRTRAFAEFYEDLGELDFSRHVLQGQEQYLGVLTVPECGWSDLGTPERVADVLSAEPADSRGTLADDCGLLLSLAAQHRRLGMARALTA